MNKYIISIDLGGTNTRIALVNSHLEIISRISFSTKKSSSRIKLISEIVSGVNRLIMNNKINKTQIMGLGIGVPGPVDYSNGKIHYLPNISGWKNTPVKKILEKEIGIRVFVDNDVNLMALAETRLGAAKNAINALCVTLGTGVGGGLMLNGELFRGTSFCAGEVGHMPINIDGPNCNCGGKGCLERYVGNSFILKEARSRFNRKDINLERLSQLAKEGHKKALDIYNNFAEKIGIALAGVVNLLNLDTIVIGGGLSLAGGFIFEKIRKTINERAMPIQAKTVKIKKAALGQDAGIIGAALLVKEIMLIKNPRQKC